MITAVDSGGNIGVVEGLPDFLPVIQHGAIRISFLQVTAKPLKSQIQQITLGV